MSNSLRPHGLHPARLLCPWDSLGKNTGVGCHFILQGIFLTQGLNLCFLHCQADSLPLSHQESPCVLFVLQGIFPTQESNLHLLHLLDWWCLTLCDPMDCSLPGFSVHGILQARTLEWVAISFSNFEAGT